MYALLALNISWNYKTIRVPYSHLVWLLEKGEWPEDGKNLDHINDDPMDNRPSNLNELTHTENQRKRRGRLVNRNYGTGKYGYGFYIYKDKRYSKYSISRCLSRGHGSGELKTIKRGLGVFNSIEDAELMVKLYIRMVKRRGLDFLPSTPVRSKRKDSIKVETRLRDITSMLKNGHSLKKIASLTGLKYMSVYNYVHKRHLPWNRQRAEWNTSNYPASSGSTS